MASLEDTIHDLVRAGELSYISVAPSQDGKKFRAVFAMCSKFGNSFAEDADPVKAILLAISTVKTKKPPRTIDLKPTREADLPTHDGLIAAAEAVEAAQADPLADLM